MYQALRRLGPHPSLQQGEQKSTCSCPNYPINNESAGAIKGEVSSAHGANAQVNTFQVLGSVDIESGINNTPFLLRFHSYTVRRV